MCSRRRYILSPCFFVAAAIVGMIALKTHFARRAPATAPPPPLPVLAAADVPSDSSDSPESGTWQADVYPSERAAVASRSVT